MAHLNRNILFLLLALPVFSFSQTKKEYKEYEICVDSTTYKGKKNHGKYHCTGWMTIRKWKDGHKDTIDYTLSHTTVIWGDEAKWWDSLTERSKYVIDSLNEDGIPQFGDNYLFYEPMYMKPGVKKEWMWRIENRGKTIAVFQYKFWNTKSGNGVELIKKIEIE